MSPALPRLLARRLAFVPILWLACLPVRAADDFLPAKLAFRHDASVINGELTVHYTIAPGYYLYRDRLGFESATPGVSVGPASFPVGEDHEDDYFGKQVVYRGEVAIGAQLAFDGPPRDFDLKLKLQGCADDGLCYPPQNWITRVAVAASPGAPGNPAPAAGAARPVAPVGAASSASATDPPKSRTGFLKGLLGGGPKSDGDFLPVDQAFVLSASSPNPDRIAIRFDIADDYYLYRDKTKVVALGALAELGDPRMPQGEVQHDEYFGEQVVYRDQFVAEIPVAAAAGTREVPLEVSYQGCADAGLCYPPTKKQLTVKLAGAAPVAAAGAATTALAADRTAVDTPPGRVRSETDMLAERIRSGNLLAVLATFFGAGLLLAFTPCVLPMVPILSGIIVGAGRDRPVSRGRAFSLSLAYVLGMALTYTVAGAAFAAAGQQAQAFFQKPWIIVLFAALFVLLALGMFGVFNLQVPAAFQARVAGLSDRQKQGTLAGTAVMGALSSLIVTACVAPPLVAALAVIGQSGDVFRGAAALFALSIGMGAPLLLVGASAGRLLPKAGAWMDTIKAVFGVMLLAVAIWMLARVLPGPLTLALWAALAFVSGYALVAHGAREATGGGAHLARRGFGALAMVYGVLMLIGALAGRSDPLQPLAGLGRGGAAVADAGHIEFRRVKTVADLEREVAAASAAGRPVMLDFYADWCVSCIEMERHTFTDAAVRTELARAVLLQADVTANDADDQALLQHFSILGPPTIVFFGADGLERPEYRVVGFKPAVEFRAHVAQAFGGTRA